MVSKGRKVARELQRRPPRLDPRPRILVVCEGVVTEAEYFEAFRQKVRAVVNLVIDDKGGMPKTLVERAAEEKRRAEALARQTRDPQSKYAEIWCVFDVDEHPLIPEARQQADANGIKLVITNPCFELWLLLHFREQTAYIHRRDVQSACRVVMPGYDKSPPIDVLDSRYSDATERAVRLSERNARDGEPERNPSTNIHILTERLRAVGSSAFLSTLTKQR